AMNALYYVDSARVPKDTPRLALVDRALSQCAKSQDRFLRQQAAYALNFWDGELVEQTLVRLAHDDGFGTVIRIEEKDLRKPWLKHKPRAPAWGSAVCCCSAA